MTTFSYGGGGNRMNVDLLKEQWMPFTDQCNQQGQRTERDLPQISRRRQTATKEKTR
jgi:hypothetical protein